MSEIITPKISVIIAVYNGAKTIEKAICSVLEQTYPAHELIVIDDGSVDGTKEIIDQFKDNVRYYYQPNAGVSVARNEGAKQASGDWLAFLDADDVYYPDRLKWHAEWIQEYPDLDFFTGNFHYKTPEGGLIRSSMETNAAGKKILEQCAGALRGVMDGALLGDFIAEHFGDTHTLTVPRKKFFQLGGYPIGYAVCEDVNFLIRLTAQSKRVGVITQPMAVYSIYKHSVTRSNPLRAQQQTLQALQALKPILNDSSTIIKNGLKRAIRKARLDLAVVLLRLKRYFEAIKIVLPLIYEIPGIRSVRDVLSVVRG